MLSFGAKTHGLLTGDQKLNQTKTTSHNFPHLVIPVFWWTLITGVDIMSPACKEVNLSQELYSLTFKYPL